MTADELRAIIQEPPKPKKPASQLTADQLRAIINPEQQSTNEPGFIQKSIEDVRARGVDAGTALREGATGQQTIPEAALNYAGAAAGAAWDVLGEGVSALAKGAYNIAPEDLRKQFESVLSETGRQFANSETGQVALGALASGVDAWNSFKKENPRIAKNLESFVNVMLFVAPPATKAKLPPVESKLGKASKYLGEKAANKSADTKKAYIEQLIRPKQTAKVKTEEVSRTVEKGFGPFKRDIVLPSEREKAITEEVAKIPEVTKGNSIQRNYNIISKNNKNIAEQLSSDVSKSTAVIPRQEYVAELDRAVSDLISTNPVIVGNAETTATRIKDKAIQIIDSHPATPSGLLDSRKELDQWIRSQKGQNIFDPVSENALSISTRTVRQTINDIIDAKVNTTKVKDELRRQNLLYDALNNMAPKAADEANTAIARAWQNVIRVLPFRGEFNQSLAALFGVGGLGASAIFAPYFTGLLAVGAVVYGGGKALLSPQAIKGISILLKGVDEAITVSKNTDMIKQLRLDRAALLEVMKNAQEQEQ